MAAGSPGQLRPAGTVLVRRGTLSFLLPVRTALVAAALGAVLLGVLLLGTLAGSSGLTAGRAFAALFGQGDPGDVLVVQQLRLPRVFTGLLVGAALGAAGCLTQTLAGNRLATPDFLGVNQGATAVVSATAAGSATGMIGQWWLGPLGAVGAAVLVVLCAGGAGVRGHRILVVGIGLSTMTGAVTDLLMSRQNAATAGGVFLWTVGSLNGRSLTTGIPLALCLAVLLPLALLAGRRLALLRFDDEIAASLGVSLAAARGTALALAVLLAGAAVGIGGPIGFVGLAAPVLASRLCGPERVPVAASALTGAALVAAADALGRVAAPVEIPVGVVTSVLGGPFLLWVLFGKRTRTS